VRTAASKSSLATLSQVIFNSDCLFPYSSSVLNGVALLLYIAAQGYTHPMHSVHPSSIMSAEQYREDHVRVVRIFELRLRRSSGLWPLVDKAWKVILLNRRHETKFAKIRVREFRGSSPAFEVFSGL
jgi:hypothetical protein